MKTLKITIPEGHVVDKFDETTGELSFKLLPKNIMERIKSFEDICLETGKDPKNYVCNSDDADDIAANALRQALLISRCFNAEVEKATKKPMDWGNSNQIKYCHVYEYDDASGWSLNSVVYWHSRAFCGSRLHFLDDNHAQYAWDTFKEIYINLIK